MPRRFVISQAWKGSAQIDEEDNSGAIDQIMECDTDAVLHSVDNSE